MQLCTDAAALLAEGRRDAAAQITRTALQQAGDDIEIVKSCAWLFGGSLCHREAAAAWECVVAAQPECADGLRHASSAALAAGNCRRAIAHARAASDRAPENAEFAFHAGSLLLDDGQAQDACGFLVRAANSAPDSGETWRQLSAAAHALGRRDEALALALHARALARESRAAAMHAAELLIQSGRAAEAAAMLRAALADGGDDAAALRLLSAAEMMDGAPAPALAAIDRAIGLAPGSPEYHVHRGSLLRESGDFAAATAAFATACTLDPDYPAAWRARLSACLDSGEIDAAIVAAGELLRTAPADCDHALAVIQALARRLELGAAAGPRVAPVPRRRRVRPPPRLIDAAMRQSRVIDALMIRETRTRFADARLGYGWAVIEPILHIVTLSVVFALLMHSRPPIGRDFAIFYYTGLIPYLVFVHASGGMVHAIRGGGAVLQLPNVTSFDVVLARFVLEVATDVVVALILLGGFAALGFSVVPDDGWRAATALLAVALLGGGIGFVNAVIGAFLPSWDKVWNQVARILYFASGIFYVPAMMPKPARDLLAWNPVLQAVDWYRSGFFAGYHPYWLDRRYLVVSAIAAVLAGLALERLLRRRLVTAP